MGAEKLVKDVNRICGNPTCTCTACFINECTSLKEYKMKASKGFNLIELMIVVMIIGIVTAFAIPSYLAYKERSVKRSRRGRGRQTKTVKERPVEREFLRVKLELGTRVGNVNINPTKSIEAYKRETERLRAANQLPSQKEYTNSGEVDYEERDCIDKLKNKGYTITRKETISITEKQTVTKEY